MWRAAWWLVAIVALATALTTMPRPHARPDVVVGTFNLQLFPREATDRSRVVDAMVELDASIVAVQEIRDPNAWFTVLWLTAERLGRDYRMLMPNCGGNGMRITTGLVYDAERWRPVMHREYAELDPDGGGRCGPSQPGLLGVFEGAGGERLAVLSVHFKPFPDGFDERKVQWASVMRILADVEARLGVPAVAMGDYNSTGFSGKPREERSFVEETVAESGFSLVTAEVPCTEYWKKNGGDYVPSMLDHAVATGGRWNAEELGMCARLACRPTPPDAMDPDYAAVSDHCAVRLRGNPWE